MVWFRENWYEEVLRQLRQGLAKCYVVAFENRGAGKYLSRFDLKSGFATNKSKENVFPM